MRPRNLGGAVPVQTGSPAAGFSFFGAAVRAGMNRLQTSSRGKSEFVNSLQKGMLLGVAVLALLVPPSALINRSATRPQEVARPQQEVTRPQEVARPQEVTPPQEAVPVLPVRLADFGRVVPSPDVRHLANWTVHVGDHQKKSFVIVDKKGASVYVFDPAGRLQAAAPVLLGSAIGDHTVPGIGDKPLAQVLPEERTTPAGRFVAEVGMNMRGEDVVWVDYDSAVSMHRVITTNPVERRLERLNSPTVLDNRISYGCINLPREFFENVLSPAVRKHGAVIYVLPDVRSVEQVFGSFDVEARVKLAQR